ncbi:molybdopterin biosynthesis protein MoeB, partial [Streptococcus thermophilus]|nr:molybdopterin biosynthesis protein MoeB [Streptococcus thermophilus]
MNSKVIKYTADFNEKRYWERIKRNLGWLGDTDEEAKKRQKKISEVVIGIAG